MKKTSNFNSERYKKIRLAIQIIIILVLVFIVVFATIKLYPYFERIQTDEEYKNYVVEKLRSYGGWSFLIIMVLQVIQTIFMIIPAGPIVMIAGILLTPGSALLSSIIGQTIGGIIVFFLVKQFGFKFIALFVDPKKIYESKLLKNTTRCEVMMFGYLMIPALPKDIVSFIAPFTGIKLKDFIIISLYARIPMTTVSVFMGSSLMDSNIVLLTILTVFSCLLALTCFIFHKKIESFLGRDEDYIYLF